MILTTAANSFMCTLVRLDVFEATVDVIHTARAVSTTLQVSWLQVCCSTVLLAKQATVGCCGA